MAPEYDVEANEYGEHEQTRMEGVVVRDKQRCDEELQEPVPSRFAPFRPTFSSHSAHPIPPDYIPSRFPRPQEHIQLLTRLAKHDKMMNMGFAIPGAMLGGCILSLRKLARELDGEVNAMIVSAVFLLVLSILLNVATWLCCEEWGSELVTASTEIKETLAMHQAASTEGEFEDRVWAFSFRYMMVVTLRTAYIFCFLPGFFLALLESSPPYLFWIWFGFGLLSSVVVIIHGSFRVYQEYGSYCSLSKSLTRIRPPIFPLQPIPCG